MFTGLIESVGAVQEIVPAAAGSRIRVATPLAGELSPGDSLAVNGVCLTVVSAGGGLVDADVSPETLRVTTLGALTCGALVNLERPMRADTRIGGHFVQGHVDATGIVEEMRREGDAYWLSIQYPGRIAQYLVSKGSIAVDGISLTIARLDETRFGVQVIPFTLQHTSLQRARAQDPVNLECDILGKYVLRALEMRRDERGE